MRFICVYVCASNNPNQRVNNLDDWEEVQEINTKTGNLCTP